MECKKCGKELPSDAKCCSHCGETVTEEKPPKTNEMKKKRKARYWLLGAAFVLFSAGVLIAIFFADIVIWFERNVLPPEMLMAKTFASAAQDVGIGQIGNGHSPATPHRYTVGIFMDEDVLELLSVTEGDSDWITDLNLQLLAGKDNGVARTQLSLFVRDEQIVSLDVLQNDENAWLGIPELNNRYLEIAKENLNLAQLNDFSNKMPSEGDLLRILRTYGTIMFDSIYKVTKENTELKVGNIHQDVLQLTAIVRPEDARRAFSQMAQKLREDKETGELLIGLSGENAHTEAVKILENLASTVDYELQLCAYLDDHNKLSGFALTAGKDNTLLYWAQAKKDGNYASRLSCGSFVLTGKGTYSGEEKTGRGSLSLDDKTVLTYKLKDFSLGKNGFTGSLTFPIEGALTGTPIFGSLSKQMSLELSQKTVSGEEVLSLNFVVAQKELAGLTFRADRADDFTADIPTAVLPANKKETVEKWVQNLNWAVVLRRLADAGVPVNAFGSLLAG